MTAQDIREAAKLKFRQTRETSMKDTNRAQEDLRSLPKDSNAVQVCAARVVDLRRELNEAETALSTVRHNHLMEKRNAERAILADWQAWLEDQNGTATLPEGVRNRLYREAWERGHDSGLTNVEVIYEDLAELALEAFKAGAASGRGKDSVENLKD